MVTKIKKFLNINPDKGSMYQYSIYLGLKGVPISLLWRLYVSTIYILGAFGLNRQETHAGVSEPSSLVCFCSKISSEVIVGARQNGGGM